MERNILEILREKIVKTGTETKDVRTVFEVLDETELGLPLYMKFNEVSNDLYNQVLLDHQKNAVFYDALVGWIDKRSKWCSADWDILEMIAKKYIKEKI